MPTFAIGVRDEYEQADEGFGKRPLPVVTGHADLSWFLAKELIYDEFDRTVCHELKVDHGLMVPLPLLFSHDPAWSIGVIPLLVNVVQHPLPTARAALPPGAELVPTVSALATADPKRLSAPERELARHVQLVLALGVDAAKLVPG